MIQAIIKNGKVVAEQVPAPIASKGAVLIKVVNSCISSGTEMSGVTESGKSLIARVLEKPAKVSKALNMVNSDGLVKTYKKIKELTDSGIPTGYSISGLVIGIGEGVTRFKIGDEVAAAGAGLANHAEFVTVPENLVIAIPDGLDFVKASTVTLGGIAMQGIRRADLSMGEFCVIIGAGVLGLLSLQMLRVAGIRVIMVDIDQARLDLALELGAEITINSKTVDGEKVVENHTGGYGADAVLFTAATSSSQPLSEAFRMCKKKGRVVLVGVVGMVIKREDMYLKELDFLISTSYGPGRYDKNYEDKGLDYPYSYVRWTENRNMEEYLRLLKIGSVNLDKMINKTFLIGEITLAFESLQNTDYKPLMVILDYGKPDRSILNEYLNHRRAIQTSSIKVESGIINIAFVGVGSFATGIHLPNIKRMSNRFRLYAVMDSNGYTAKSIADRYGAVFATTDYNDILREPNINLVFIATRHDSHSDLALQALSAGKHVFVEKPLATNQSDLNKIKSFFTSKPETPKPLLLVGFNRRFSKYAREIKKQTDKRINPLFIRYRMNAGYIPLDHWVHEHGGRIVGEACHIIDLMTYFTEALITSVSVESIKPKTSYISGNDNKTILLKYDDGSICSIDYFAVGSKEISKEWMEIHFDGKTIILNDYKSVNGYGVNLKKTTSSLSEKGHLEELEVLYDAVKNEKDEWPIQIWDMLQTTEIALRIAN